MNKIKWAIAQPKTGNKKEKRPSNSPCKFGFARNVLVDLLCQPIEDMSYREADQIYRNKIIRAKETLSQEVSQPNTELSEPERGKFDK